MIKASRNIAHICRYTKVGMLLRVHVFLGINCKFFCNLQQHYIDQNLSWKLRNTVSLKCHKKFSSPYIFNFW